MAYNKTSGMLLMGRLLATNLGDKSVGVKKRNKGIERQNIKAKTQSNADTKRTATHRLNGVIKESSTIATSTLYTLHTTYRNIVRNGITYKTLFA